MSTRTDSVPDEQIRELLARDADAGWRAFVDRYTPLLLALIERAGISDHDEAMDLYLRTCERLSADGCARLLRHDPEKGPWSAWLPAVVRNVMVDWIRSRAGRRRLFGVIETLTAREQQVFELYYWNGRTPSEICETLSSQEHGRVTLTQVFDALDAIERVLSVRHRRELLATTARSQGPLSLDAEMEDTGFDYRDPAAAADRTVRRRETIETLNRALGSLDPEDAAIVRLKYIHGLSTRDVQRALHLDRLTDERVRSVGARLRALLAHSMAAAGAVLGLAAGGAP
jgi:DNA-directed RNA polymerase specialized sigma24 family protein